MINLDIQVGEYVRTYNQGIKRIDVIDENKVINRYLYFIGYDHNDKEYKIIKTTDIISHSFNLIDLIKEGDYVNGEQVIQKDDDGIYIGLPEDYGWMGEDFIDTIVTKEQFKSMEYKVVINNEKIWILRI